MNTPSTSNSLIRRKFICLSAQATCGLAVPGLVGGLANAKVMLDDAESVDRSYLQRGLNALARAHHMSSMAGHLGASMIAAYFVAKQRPKLDQEVLDGMKDDLRRVVQGESVFGKKMSRQSKLTDSELFEPFPKEHADETLVDGIADGLEKGIDKPRQSGHNVIFASLAIAALKEHPEFATPSVVNGVRKLMDLFASQTPGSGYYGKQRGRVKGDKIILPDEDRTPAYDDIDSMANAVLDETATLSPKVHRVGYGGLVHIINHGAAIVGLDDFGYAELAQRATRSHRHHLRLWRNLPNVVDEKGPLRASRFTPHTASYWTSGNIPYDRALLTHRIKTMYGFAELARATDERAKEKAAYEKLRYLM